MNFRNFGLRINPPGPFWYEDLMYFLIDETRRLPARLSSFKSRLRAQLREEWAQLNSELQQVSRYFAPAKPAVKASAPARVADVPALADDETWSLATDPIAAGSHSIRSVRESHASAAEQIDSLSYVLDQLRADLRPYMKYHPLETDNIETLPTQAELETSIEALLELSRTCAATRPKERIAAVA